MEFTIQCSCGLRAVKHLGGKLFGYKKLLALLRGIIACSIRFGFNNWKSDFQLFGWQRRAQLGPWHKDMIDSENPALAHCQRRMYMPNTSSFARLLESVAAEGPRWPGWRISSLSLLKSRLPVAICRAVCMTNAKRCAFLKCWPLGILCVIESPFIVLRYTTESCAKRFKTITPWPHGKPPKVLLVHPKVNFMQWYSCSNV